MSRRAPLGLEPLESRETPAVNFTAFGAAAGGRPLVEVLRPDGTILARFEAFQDDFRGGVRAAAGELDGDPSTVEVIAAAGPGGGPAVEVFKVNVTTGQVLPVLTFFAMDPAFTGGLRVTAGNVAGPDARQEIVVAADTGGGPRVQTFDLNGNTVVQTDGPLRDFFAMDPAFRGGVRVTAGELDGNLLDGDELVVAAGVTGGPRVQVYRSDGAVLADYFAFNPAFRGGVDVVFQPAGTPVAVGRVAMDTLLEDPSQRDAALNDAAGVPTTTATPTTPTTATTAGAAVTASPGMTAAANGTTPGLSTAGFAINPFPAGSLGAGAIGSSPSTAVLGNTFTRIGPTTSFGIGTVATTGLTTTALGSTISGTTPTTTITPTATATTTTANPFGDPGPEAPFPVLVSPPFLGPTIGLTSFATTPGV